MSRSSMRLKDFALPPLRDALRVLIKALIILTVANVVLLAADINPVHALIRLNTFDLLGKARTRLIYPGDLANGQLPVEALLAAHAAGTPKPAGEYRVFLLGDAGIAGWGVPDGDTLADELNELALRRIGQRVVVYNLAYPQPSALRDLLILDAALAYEPDLIVWFVTPETLNNAPSADESNPVFYEINADRLAALAEEYPDLVGGWVQARNLLPAGPEGPRLTTLRDQGLLPIWLRSLSYPFRQAHLARLPDPPEGLPPPPRPRYTMQHPGFRNMPDNVWDILRAGCRAAGAGGAELVVVNQPIAVGEEQGAVASYNQRYGREMYDRYREALVWFTDYYGLWYVDLWDAIPSGRFMDAPTHLDALGHKMLAAQLQNVLTGQGGSACR
ncbi:MAG TPA: hypothetical protein PK801_01460 [Aggregatilineales bacterium]|nr:hypothetical protein [Aggregatilineales bacterium]